MAETQPALHLSPVKQRLLEAVRSRPGISARQLRDTLFLRLRFPIHLAGGNIDPELGKLGRIAGAFGTSSRGGSPLIVPVPKSGGLAASGCLVLSARGFLGDFGHSINMPMGPALSKRPSGWSRSRWRCSGWRRSEAHCAPARSLPTAGFHFLAQHPERHIVWRGSSSRRPRL
jgi:hypothetical protein